MRIPFQIALENHAKKFNIFFIRSNNTIQIERKRNNGLTTTRDAFELRDINVKQERRGPVDNLGNFVLQVV